MNSVDINNLNNYRIRSHNTGNDFTKTIFIKEFEKQDNKFQELFNILLNKDNFNNFVNSPNNNNDELKNVLVSYNALNTDKDNNIVLENDNEMVFGQLWLKNVLGGPCIRELCGP